MQEAVTEQLPRHERGRHAGRIVAGIAPRPQHQGHQPLIAQQPLQQEADAGRTVAVVGTGLDTVYPAENRGLHDRILRNGGAVISQFWPDFRGRAGGANFIARNRTMADLSLATVVVEASMRSGARSQAVHVQKSGGALFLLRSLVENEEWARAMAEKPGCHVVDGVDDLLSRLPD